MVAVGNGFMKLRSTLLILSSPLILLSIFILGIYLFYAAYSSSRKYYRIYEENGKYYYRGNIGFGGFTYEKNFIEFEDGLALIRENRVEFGKGLSTLIVFKYINKKGRVVLRPDVYAADAFSEGLAAVMPFEGSLRGYMNKNCEMVIEPKYILASMFKDGFASVWYDEGDGGKWILINKKGEYIRDLDKPLNWKSHTQINPCSVSSPFCSIKFGDSDK